ncbi:MAG: 2-succinyl-6-hydroxy-2,4-cyclohexadiene-1-carboxylate synthase [Melioribacter sp.]|nr:2-succinyl-6-hydroxy-2,4-cyclohexadiene-1-carboxylate synthase [Melioribacter sp.]
MKININQINFNIIPDDFKFIEEKIPIVFLHGFTGSSEDWTFIFDKLPEKYSPLAIDLIGHGLSDSPENPNFYTCSAIINQLDLIFNFLTIKKLILCGYSMGGRAALSYCIRYPQKIVAAILESTTAGITDYTLKKEKVISDFLLAEKIRKEGIKSFIDDWMNNSLFQSLKKLPDFENIKNKKYKNNAIGLSNSLIGFTTGLMPDYWKKLNLLNFPILLISGNLDEKYTTIAKEMKLKLPDAEHKIANQCGHNVHLEKPDVFVKFVKEFLKKIEREYL